MFWTRPASSMILQINLAPLRDDSSDLLLLGGCAGNVLAQHLGVLIELLRCALLKRKLPGRVVFPSQPLVGCGERKVYSWILGRELGGSFERFHCIRGLAGIQQGPAQAEVRLAE